MNKRRTIFILLAILSATLLQAQEVNRQLPSTVDTIKYRGGAADLLLSETKKNVQEIVKDNRRYEGMELRSDALSLPEVNYLGQARPALLSPMHWGGWYGWQLHQGLNVSLGASVFAQFGKNAWYKGAGFQQNLSMMFAHPVNNHLSVAVGGYLNNISWAHQSFRDAGLNAIIGYRFNNRWEAYLYGQKSLTNNVNSLYYSTNQYVGMRYPYMMTPLYDMSVIGDRIGAAVKYNFSPTFSIYVSVEEVSLPVSSLSPPYPPRNEK